jgi:hypothetical protein
MDDQPGARVLLELRAREAWSQRDYQKAASIAGEAADAARHLGDENTWWNMSFLRAQCFREDGQMQLAADQSFDLKGHPVTEHSPYLAARVLTLRASVLQGLGRLPAAVVEATDAAASAAIAPAGQDLRIEAQHVLIATLAESGRLDEAWQECTSLDALLDDDVSTQTAGKGYWVIGNVAFLTRRIPEGLKYHRLAANNLSPTNDLDLWARFNHASAAKRLAAGVVEPETLECIDRAEMASSIVGGSERDRLELALTRAHWLVLTGQFDAAIDRLRAVTSQESLLATHTAAEARFLLGQAFNARHIELEALLNLEASEQLFVQSGASDRAAAARELIDEVQRR